MKYVQLNGYPTVEFAHKYQSVNYTNHIPEKSERMELSFVAEGEYTLMQEGKREVAKANYLICNLHAQPLEIYCNGHHKHFTVGFQIPFQTVNFDGENILSLPLTTDLKREKHAVLNVFQEIIRTNVLHENNHFTKAGLILELLGKIDMLNRMPSDKTTYGNAYYVEKAKDYVYKHLHLPVRQSEIAEYLNITPEYLCSVFKKTEGIPFMQFINQTKLKELRSIMVREHLKLYEAAELFGYSDANYVSRLYKKLFGQNITADF